MKIWALILFAALGVGANLALSDLFYELRGGTSGFASYCNIDQTMNCDAVTGSRFAELLPGLPLSSFGAGWFLALLIVAWLARNPFWRRDAVRASFALSAFAVLCGAFYLIVMAVEIGTFCIMCLVVDLAATGALLTSLSLKPEGFSKHAADRSKWKVFGGILAGSLVVMVFGLKAFLQVPGFPGIDNDTMAKQVLQSSPHAIQLPADALAIGPSDAPITIQEFSDFQCPYCRMGAQRLKALQHRYPGKIRVVLRNFPLDPSCNPQIQGRGHPMACAAARTVFCAEKQGKFEAVYEEIFENQAELRSKPPVELAVRSGVDRAALEQCMSAGTADNAIARDIREAMELKVQATPTFFVNGLKVEGPAPLEVWFQIIDELLKRSKP